MNCILKSAVFSLYRRYYTLYPKFHIINFLCLYLRYHGRPCNPLVGIFHSFSDNGNSGRLCRSRRTREVKYGREHRKCSTKLLRLIHGSACPVNIISTRGNEETTQQRLNFLFTLPSECVPSNYSYNKHAVLAVGGGGGAGVLMIKCGKQRPFNGITHRAFTARVPIMNLK